MALTFDAAAAVAERPDVALDAGGPFDLVLKQVRVVGRGNEVVGERLRHVLAHGPLHRVEDVAVLRQQELGETCQKDRKKMSNK